MADAFAQTLHEALALVPALTEASGNVIRRYFRQPFEIIDKEDQSPVTVADRETEGALRQLIAQRFPDHGFIGEESGAERADAEFVWIIDPIDGTKSFICGVPLFGTLIALLYQGEPVLGVLDQPISGERWVGARGQPSLHNDRPIRTRSCTEIAKAALFTTAPELFSPAESPLFERVHAAAKLTRYGTDCYAYGLVALGCIDAVIEAGLKPYDYAALIPIIEGAGGIVTGWRGEKPMVSPNGRILATGDRRLHDEILRLIA